MKFLELLFYKKTKLNKEIENLKNEIKRLKELIPNDLTLYSYDGKFKIHYDLKRKIITIPEGSPEAWEVYSSIKDHWKNEMRLIYFPFPILYIDKYTYEIDNGWKLFHNFNITTYTIDLKISNIRKDEF